MGTFHTSCPHCGEEISGRWAKGEAELSEPAEVSVGRATHLKECVGVAAAKAERVRIYSWARRRATYWRTRAAEQLDRLDLKHAEECKAHALGIEEIIGAIEREDYR